MLTVLLNNILPYPLILFFTPIFPHFGGDLSFIFRYHFRTDDKILVMIEKLFNRKINRDVFVMNVRDIGEMRVGNMVRHEKEIL